MIFTHRQAYVYGLNNREYIFEGHNIDFSITDNCQIIDSAPLGGAALEGGTIEFWYCPPGYTIIIKDSNNEKG